MPSFDTIVARNRDIGGFTVRRALPALVGMVRRRVGPFLFWDHMGPETLEPGHGMDVRPHPHIELATVTYLFDGEIVHKDSLGSDIAIRPGDVNLMTAGRGIVHSERTGPEVRKRGSRVHGIQAWLGLPLKHEQTDPTFQHVGLKDLPDVELEGSRLRVIAGTAYGEESPVRVLSPMFYVDGVLEAQAELAVPSPDEHAERAVYVAEGAIELGGDPVEEGTMALVDEGVEIAIRALRPSRVMLLGGAPLDGERHIWWNFVSSSEERIEHAKTRWTAREFPKVPGDEQEWIPLPK
jgi:redox-sensitive bicupin YhaK (pirin superfamily)